MTIMVMMMTMTMTTMMMMIILGGGNETSGMRCFLCRPTTHWSSNCDAVAVQDVTEIHIRPTTCIYSPQRIW